MRIGRKTTSTMWRTAATMGVRRETEEKGAVPGVVSLCPALCADAAGLGSAICTGCFACSRHAV